MFNNLFKINPKNYIDEQRQSIYALYKYNYEDYKEQSRSRYNNDIESIYDKENDVQVQKIYDNNINSLCNSIKFLEILLAQHEKDSEENNNLINVLKNDLDTLKKNERELNSRILSLKKLFIYSYNVGCRFNKQNSQLKIENEKLLNSLKNLNYKYNKTIKKNEYTPGDFIEHQIKFKKVINELTTDYIIV